MPLFYPGGSDSFLLYLGLILAAILSVAAQSFVNSNYRRYHAVRSLNGITGKQVAESIMRQQGINDVNIVMSQGGILSDHYDPSKKIVALSKEVYEGDSIAAIAVAAHEVGHVIQHAQAYGWIAVRNNILPLTMFASQIGMGAFIIGLILQINFLMIAGVIAMVVIMLFQIVTLPIEFDASRRALKILEDGKYLTPEEIPSAKNMLRAAAFTYVAGVIGSIMNVLYYASFSNRNKN